TIYTRPGATTTVVAPLAMDLHNPQAVLVFDLRYDPTPFLGRSAEELRATAFTPRREQPDEEHLPVSRVALNKVPAIAPEATLDDEGAKRLGIDRRAVAAHLEVIRNNPSFLRKVRSAFAPVEKGIFRDVEEQLYAGFVPDSDRSLYGEIHRLSPEELLRWEPPFRDERLPTLYHRFLMRNYEELLEPEQRRDWYREAARRILLPPSTKLKDLEEYELRVSQILGDPQRDESERRTAEELKRYAESVRATLPIDD
ncbi:MAG: hypothetical protein ACOC45_06810, partial [Alkalispirochaetaceae bacterium]